MLVERTILYGEGIVALNEGQHGGAIVASPEKGISVAWLLGVGKKGLT
jgi:hypothetical protein